MHLIGVQTSLTTTNNVDLCRAKKKEMEARPQKTQVDHTRLTNLNKTVSDKGASGARMDGRCKALKRYRVFGTMSFFFNY